MFIIVYLPCPGFTVVLYYCHCMCKVVSDKRANEVRLKTSYPREGALLTLNDAELVKYE